LASRTNIPNGTGKELPSEPDPRPIGRSKPLTGLVIEETPVALNEALHLFVLADPELAAAAPLNVWVSLPADPALATAYLDRRDVKSERPLSREALHRLLFLTNIAAEPIASHGRMTTYADFDRMSPWYEMRPTLPRQIDIEVDVSGSGHERLEAVERLSAWYATHRRSEHDAWTVAAPDGLPIDRGAVAALDARLGRG
jgi:hypothetical protein